MSDISKISDEELTRVLTYTGFILVAFELIKSMVVNPIKMFYSNITFPENSEFTSYEKDVMSRHKNHFEACLLYLRDFMEAIDSEDVLTIQALRKHRNDLAHNLPGMLSEIDIKENISLLERTDKALFKLSNYRIYIEIGSDPEFRDKGINWDTIKGPEYALFEEVLRKIKVAEGNRHHA